MYKRFTDRARQLIQRVAYQEAYRLDHEYVRTEHILLGLVNEGSGVAASVLKNLDVDLRNVRMEVEKIVQSGPELVRMALAPLAPLTPSAKNVIKYAREESRNLNNDYVGTEHLLLGLLREEWGVAAEVLRGCGADFTTVRKHVVTIHDSFPKKIGPLRPTSWHTRPSRRREQLYLTNHAGSGISQAPRDAPLFDRNQRRGNDRRFLKREFRIGASHPEPYWLRLATRFAGEVFLPLESQKQRIRAEVSPKLVANAEHES